MPAIQRILVIDDEEDACEFIALAARSMGLSCTATTDAAAFLEALSPDTSLVIIDLLMPTLDGIELLRVLAQQKCKAGVVLMSGIEKRVIETAEQLAQALGLSIVGRLRKPFGIANLEEVLKNYEASSATAVERQAPPDITEEELRTAISRDDFVLHFQPQIDIATRTVVGVEGLVRLLHPTLGVVCPDHFINRAEALGLIDDLGWLVLRKGLKAWDTFRDSDGNLPNLSLNVSTLSLQVLDFPDKVGSLLKEHSKSPGKLMLEVTESGVLDNLSSSLDVLARLRLKGVQLSVDDFGIGYSMLQQLRRIPATEIKIDKSFVQRMLTNYGDSIVVQKTIEIGHKLGMRMVAEGVETQAQLDYLEAHRCDVAQGYLFCRPLPTAILQSWLQRYRSTPTLATPFIC